MGFCALPKPEPGTVGAVGKGAAEGTHDGFGDGIKKPVASVLSLATSWSR